MLGASAFFAFRVYEHIQTLQDPKKEENLTSKDNEDNTDVQRSADAFSTFDVDSLVQKADEARENEDFDRAIAIYREANIKEDKNPEVLFKMGYTLKQATRYDEALEYLLESVEIDTQNPFAYKTIAEIYTELDDKEKSDEYYKKAVALDENI